MQKSEMRKRITELADEALSSCDETTSDAFMDELHQFCNDIESAIGNVLSNFEIDDVGDLYKIEDAKSQLEDLQNSFW